MSAQKKPIPSGAALSLERDEMVKRLVYRTCETLDGEDFAGYLQLCSADFRYKIVAYSPDIRKEMVWLEHDRKGMETMFGMIPQHVRMPGRFMRHVSVYDVVWDAAGEQANVTSSLLVVYTDLEGASRLFAAGRYHDVIDARGELPRLTSRVARLETRDLGPGSHLPM